MPRLQTRSRPEPKLTDVIALAALLVATAVVFGGVDFSRGTRTQSNASASPTAAANDRDGDVPLAKRCTWGVVWTASAVVNREGNAVALAVQPLEAWRELWLFTKQGKDWSVQVLPPSAAAPEVG